MESLEAEEEAEGDIGCYLPAHPVSLLALRCPLKYVHRE